MTTIQGETISWTVDGDGLCELELHRAPLNEIGEQTLEELERFVRFLRGPLALGPAAKLGDVLERIPGVNGRFVGRGRGKVRGLLIRSRVERGFSAGADLRALHEAIENHGQMLVVRFAGPFLRRINRVLSALDELPIPTIAAVHGVTFGGGLELALTCDMIVADRTARFAFPELRLGLIPGWGGMSRLARDTGNARLRDLLLTGRSLNAERAREAGFVSQVVAPGKQVAVARSALRQSIKLPPAAVAAAKRHLKPIDPAVIEEEIRTFLRLLARPEAKQALARFASSDAVLPYLP